MTITKTKLGARIDNARVSYWLASHLVCDVFCVDFPDFDEQCKLMDKLSVAEKSLKGRYEALEKAYEDVYGEKYYPESIVTASKNTMRMYDSLWRYQRMAKKLTEEMRLTA